MPSFARTIERLSALSPRVKAVAVGGIVVALLALATILSVTRDARVALFATPLKADQLGEVETHLAAWRIAYAPSADNVRVDARARADILLRLSVAGVPQRHVTTTDEAFAKVGALTPQSIVEAQTRDALAAELTQGLRGLDGVADARVIVAPASGGIYADDAARDASASVRISLAPGAHLTASTVAGIRAFVAGGVPGLDAARVTVLDDRGELDGGERGPDETGVQTGLQTALDTAFGAGATIVRVHREPLGEHRERHDSKRVALPGAVTRTLADEHYSGEKKTYAKTNSTEDRGSETHDERRDASPDATARLSVAIFVDGSRLIDLEKIRALAEAAAGIDRSRGDTLRVEAVRFAPAARPGLRGVDAWAIAGLFAGLVPQLGICAALVVLVCVGGRPACAAALRVFERASARSVARETAGLPPSRVRGALADEPPHVAAAVISALPAATATAVLELYPPEERAQIVRRLSRAAVDLVPGVEELLRARG